jgi:hypothetical protein
MYITNNQTCAQGSFYFAWESGFFYFFMPKIPYIFINNIINTIYICQFRCGRTNSTQKMRYEDILGHTSDAAKRK